MAIENDFTDTNGPFAGGGGGGGEAPSRNARDMEAVYDIPVTVSAVLAVPRCR